MRGAICNGTNVETVVTNIICPNCGGAYYLGVFIPTVTVTTSDYYSPYFKCNNPGCSPIIKERVISWDRDGEDCEPFIIYDFVDYGAYWDGEDKFYYTPLAPRV